MLLLLSLSPDASIKNTLMTGASSVRELSTHQLINSPKKAELLCLSLLSFSVALLLPASCCGPKGKAGRSPSGAAGPQASVHVFAFPFRTDLP